jgi:hypothetical protein
VTTLSLSRTPLLAPVRNVDFHVCVVHCWSSQSPYRLVSILIIIMAYHHFTVKNSPRLAEHCRVSKGIARGRLPSSVEEETERIRLPAGTFVRASWLSRAQSLTNSTNVLPVDAPGANASSAFLLVAAVLVFVMTPAVGLFYSGLSRQKHALTLQLLAFSSLQ